MEKLKSFLMGIKNKTTGKKVVILMAFAAAAVGIAFLLQKDNAQAKGSEIMPRGVRTTTLRQTTLADSVTVTGTVESTQTVSVTSTVSGTTVSEILVQAGDYVNEGQTLIKLDTGDILEKIEEEKEKLAENTEKAQSAYTKAENTKAAAYDTAIGAENTLAAADKRLSAAAVNFNAAKNAVALQQSEYDTADVEYTNALNSHNNAVAAMNTSLTAKNAAWDKYNTAKAAYEKAENEYNAADSYAENYAWLEAEYIRTKAEYESAAAGYNTASSAYDAACSTAGYTAEKNSDGSYTGSVTETGEGTLAAYRRADESLKKADNELKTAKAGSQYDTLEKTYNDALTARTKARTALDSAEAAYEKAVEAFETAEDNLENSSTSDTLQQLYEDYNDCIIKAAVSGTVTAVNTTAGSVANGTLMTIEDTSNLKISTSFRESDVQNISIGMKCIITSDANDKQLSGYVSQISPVASSGGMNSSGDVSFPGEITISGTDHGLLIGMNAKAEVIITEISNVFVVPYDAVGTDENGSKVVYVQSGEEFTPVEVTTGMETDYYIEISSDKLSAGMVIRSSANRDESESMAFTEDGEETEENEKGFGFGGMMGMPNGTMPSGGGMQGGRPSGGMGGRG